MTLQVSFLVTMWWGNLGGKSYILYAISIRPPTCSLRDTWEYTQQNYCHKRARFQKRSKGSERGDDGE